MGDNIPKFDSIIIKEPLKKQYLTLEFEEGDSVLAGIHQGMVDNGVKEADVVDVSGTLATASVNAMEGHHYKKIDFANTQILRASGHFKLTAGDMWGSLHIFTQGRKPISGTVLKATASTGFTLKLSFLP